MARTLTLVPWDAANLRFGAAQTQSFTAWGINDGFDGAFKSLVPDELNLTLAGGALAATPFAFRSLVKLTLDDKPFFSGYVVNDVSRNGTGERNESHLPIQGPWWFLEDLIYQLDVPILTAVSDGAPVYTHYFYTHFTLNISLQPNFTSGVTNTISYGSVLLDSRAQIAAVLDYAINRGAYLAYDRNDLLSVPVLPADVLNISCAEAIRRQLADVDAVAWFDHTQDPPKFHCQRRKDLPARTVTVPADARGFEGLHERKDLKVPYVIINFEQPYSVGEISGINLGRDFYPNPLPADDFKALITTVPIRAVAGSTHNKWIKTEPVDLNSLAWWQRRFPEMNPDLNPNYATDFKDLAFTPGTAPTRQTSLPHMIIEGGYATWMGGAMAKDHAIGQFSYSRSTDAYRPESKYSSHTKRKSFHATTLNFPDGINFEVTEFSSVGESLADFKGLAQIIYTDLNARQWEGNVPVFEDRFSAQNVLGKNLNLAGGLADWTTMAALVQQIDFTVRTGGIHYTLQCGPNKNISPDQIADRLRAARSRYATAFFFGPAPEGIAVTHPKQEGLEESGEAQATSSQQHIGSADGKSGVLIQGNPHIILQSYSDDGTVLTPDSPTPSGSITIELGKCLGSDGKWHNLVIMEMKVCKDNKQRTTMGLFCEPYKAPDDPV